MKTKMSCDPEADVLRIEVRHEPIDYATEFGNVIMHFSRRSQPVSFEILQAANFLKRALTLLCPTLIRRALVAPR